jgi:hypothetical protein
MFSEKSHLTILRRTSESLTYILIFYDKQLTQDLPYSVVSQIPSQVLFCEQIPFAYKTVGEASLDGFKEQAHG